MHHWSKARIVAGAFVRWSQPQPLVNPDLARVTLVPTAVGLPLMFASDPWLLTLLDQPLFILLCGVVSPPHQLLMQVALWVFVDLLKPAAACLYAS